MLIVVCYRANEEKFRRAWTKRFPRVSLTKIGSFVKKDAMPAGAVRLVDYSGYEHLR